MAHPVQFEMARVLRYPLGSLGRSPMDGDWQSVLVRAFPWEPREGITQFNSYCTEENGC